jgi:hypothetical protein
MAKRRKHRPHKIPERTRELTGLARQMQLANEWYMRLTDHDRFDIAQSAGSTDISGAVLAAYRARKDAGRPG